MKKMWMMLFVVFLVACSSGETAKESGQETVETVQPAAEAQVEAPNEAAPVESMTADLDSMFLSGAKCVSTQEGQTATVYMKGGKVRMDTLPVDAHAIYDEDMMYAWSGVQGTKMRRSDMEKLAQSAGQQTMKSPEQVTGEMRDPNVKCEPSAVSSDVFVPPADVQFMDLGEMMSKQYGVTMPQQ